MSEQSSRIAYFTDAYLEVDGVANTARQFEAYARRQHLPFLILHGGYDREKIVHEDSITRVELPRSPLGFALDRKHEFDLVFLRHLFRAEEIIRKFRPDVLHITGPSDVGILGAIVARRLNIPLVGSWHTNIHEYAERRSLPLLGFVPKRWRQRLAGNIRERSFLVTGRFYRIPRVLMAPNRELIGLLERATHRPCYLMSRGVDAELFHPRRRNRKPGPFTIGYVGRITVEKNVESLIEIERALQAAGISDYRFLIVGQGASEDLLRSSLQRADFTGVLQGEELAQAYANMDVFLFPSKTDTFGNVVLEAMASGVPALVTNHGGPQFTISAGVSGFVCGSTSEFVECLARLQQSQEMLETMRHAARKQAESASWDSVFAAVQRAYQVALQPSPSSGGPLNVKFGASAVAKT
jgi:phosphatidylinositol alpha 1,6-mannosyltransferase